MRPWRSGWTNAAVTVAVVLTGGVLPWWLALILAVGVVKLDKWFFYSQELRAAEQPLDDPELVAQAEAVCREAGVPHLQVVAVKGDGGPYLNLRGDRLLVSREAAEVLKEEELRAAILHRAVTPPGHAWRLEVEPHLPWGLAALLAGVAVQQEIPWAWLGLMASLMLWAWSVGAGRPYCPWLTRDHFQAFLARGGDGPALITALAKINWHIAGGLTTGSIQDRMAARAWANLTLMAGLCGMSEDDAVAMADRNGLSDLYLSARMSVWHRMGFARKVFVSAGAGPLLWIVTGLLAWNMGDAIARMIYHP